MLGTRCFAGMIPSTDSHSVAPGERLLLRRQFLQIASGTAAAFLTGGRTLGQGATPTLREIAKSKGLLVGSALSWPKLQSPEVAALIAAQCSIIVPENELKWGVTQPERDRYDFSKGDAMLAFAEAHGQRMRGHNLCWHDIVAARVKVSRKQRSNLAAASR
jgi:endo-1,4-beta-xylanase